MMQGTGTRLRQRRGAAMVAILTSLSLMLLVLGCSSGVVGAASGKTTVATSGGVKNVTSTATSTTSAMAPATDTSEPDMTVGTVNTTTAGDTSDITQDLYSPAEAVVAKVNASVVNVRVTGVVASRRWGSQPYEGIGSGIVYTSDGYILTNNHVVSLNGVAAQTVVVTFSSGETASATIVATDPQRDLAAIKVNRTGLTPVTFSKSGKARLGAWVVAIGSPSDYQNSVTLGIISGLNRELDTGDPNTPTLTGLVQTDAAISPGNSGGGLFDAQGRLLGMPEAYLPPVSTGAENIGFAIPADTVAAAGKALTGR
jgi:S1-C subfamily serine protease